MIKYIIFGFTIIGVVIVLVLLIYALLGIDIASRWQDDEKH